ncbi:hypothetical protein [Pseudofrankia asymbiotica]|uniref:Uncharacterized protein n=1 Tax=Pseudofrankia asymbiotica TaxID=1834516 RepID=A0A1V2I2F3_9ACTN|nr:hypothetical protein [Pseudofrankia asymbiotica]ONH24169.1 hypothetical protein BL253_30900 [Pseudofrankia asymbiotica]
MRRYYYRSPWSPIIRWSLGFGLLFVVLSLFSFVASRVLSVVGPFVIVAGLVWAGFVVVSRMRDR